MTTMMEMTTRRTIIMKMTMRRTVREVTINRVTVLGKAVAVQVAVQVLAVVAPSTGCTLNVGGVTTNYTKCYQMGAGTTYFSLNGNTLSVGYKVKSAGWAALAVGKPHQGASAVWSSTCGATCAKATGIPMRSFNPSQIAAPSLIPFSNIKASKSAASEYAASFTMPWPSSAASIQVALANGAGVKSQHATILTKYTVNKADVISKTPAIGK